MEHSIAVTAANLERGYRVPDPRANMESPRLEASEETFDPARLREAEDALVAKIGSIFGPRNVMGTRDSIRVLFHPEIVRFTDAWLAASGRVA